MSCRNDLPAVRSRKQRHLRSPSSPQYASSSTLPSRHSRIWSSTSLPAYTCSFQDDLDSLDEPVLDSDSDQCTASSSTLLSSRLSPSPSTNWFLTDNDRASSEPDSHPSCFTYSLHEPGQMTAERIRRLRARTASVILSIPATCEGMTDIDEDEDEAREAVVALPATQASKLRRVQGVRDLRRAFRDADPRPAHLASTSSFELSKASYELGILVTTQPFSQCHLSPRSSLRTLVDMGNLLPRKSADLKTLCESTLSSISLASRFTTKAQSPFPRSFSSQYTCLPTDTSPPKFPRKYPTDNSSTPRPRRHVSLHQDAHLSHPPGETIWSCAKISQSAIKRAARREHPPRRVFSNPIAGLSP